MEYVHRYLSPLGGMTMVSDGRALTALAFDGSAYPPDVRAAAGNDRLPVFAITEKWLDTYFTGQIPDAAPPLSPHGTPFQEAVWRILLTVPYGRTTTYGAIAAQIARERALPRMSAQAVGGAVGRNPIALIIPCHRVIGADGSITGYAAGTERKSRLLAMERTHIPRF